MKTPKILIIQNCEVEGFGLYEKYFIDNSIEYAVIHPYRDGSFPQAGLYDIFLIGGTPISINNAADHFFLRRESEYLMEAIQDKKPCLGICGGGQLLAKLLGASVTKCPVKEIGGYEVRLTDSGRKDPLFKGFPRSFPVFHWHGDTFEIPAGAELLAEGDDCQNQLFRLNNIIGVIFHLEITCQDAGNWADAYSTELTEFGKTKEQIMAECKERETERRALAKLFISNFLDMVF